MNDKFPWLSAAAVVIGLFGLFGPQCWLDSGATLEVQILPPQIRVVDVTTPCDSVVEDFPVENY